MGNRYSHGMQKSRCMECTGCPHGKVKCRCAVCIPCPHEKLKCGCKECTPCPHSKVKHGCNKCYPCPHGRLKRNCVDCNRCPHGRLKGRCAECKPCPHGKTEEQVRGVQSGTRGFPKLEAGEARAREFAQDRARPGNQARARAVHHPWLLRLLRRRPVIFCLITFVNKK